MSNELEKLAEDARPDAFSCPYRKPCFQRESLRYLMTILIAAVTAYATGCAGKLHLKGFPPGIDMSMQWDDGSGNAINYKQASATTKPVERN